MRVICIDDSRQVREPKVVMGNEYFVTAAFLRNGDSLIENSIEYKCRDGLYYKLDGMGSNLLYHHSIFSEIKEDQQDETEMERDYDSVKILSHKVED